MGVSSAFATDDGASIDWETASPSDIHQHMGEGKARAFFDREFVRKIETQHALANTQDNYDVKYYDVFIRVNDTTEILYGHVGFLVEATTTGVSELQIDLHQAMTVDSVVGPGGALAFTHADDYVTLTLDHAYSTGEQVFFTVYYHGHPVEGGLQAMAFDTRSTGKVIASLSEPYFAHTWWPCKDLMEDKPDSMGIAIEVDTAFYVGSNGTLDSIVTASANSHTFHYTERYPIATYLFSIAVSKYQVWHQYYYYNGGADSMLITNAVYPDQYSYSLPRWGIVPTAIQYFADAYGPYPFLNEKYGHSNFQWGGGMEHQTMTSMVGSSFGFAEATVVHELSHQWWGDMITCASWHDIWLNEGWASYSEAVYYLAKSGWSTYRSYMNGMAYTGGGTIWCDDTTDVWRIFNGGLSYDKGSWVPHMLRGVLGEEAWAAGVDAYYNSQYQYGAATTEDFKNVFEQSSGRDLDWFFDEWIYGTYRPNYYYYYTSKPSDTGGYDVYVVVKQIQTSEPKVFTMPIDFLVNHVSTPSDTAVLFNDQRQQLFRLNFDDDITSMVLDPDGWILKYASVNNWTMFIVTYGDELSDGWTDSAYVDTIQAIGGSGSYAYSIINGALPDGLGIGSDGRITGVPTSAGSFNFTVRVRDLSQGYTDTLNCDLTVHLTPCCGRYTGGLTGNIDCDTEGKYALADITRLIDFVYLSKQPLCCNANGNLDGSSDGKINLSDITRLIDRVYLSRNPTVACP